MSTSVETLLNHLEAIADAVRELGLGGAYTALPEIRATMSLNTFRMFAPVVVATAERVTQEHVTVVEGLHSQVAYLQAENTALRAELAEEKRLHSDYATPTEMVTQPSMQPPKSFEGWTVQTGKDGYIRLHRKVDGRGLSIHLGRTWDTGKAHEKITAKRPHP
jgi:hypothetical protein